MNIILIIIPLLGQCGYTDLRYGIDGLTGSRRCRYILLYKRLSNGRFQWSRSEAELRLPKAQMPWGDEVQPESE